MSYANKVGDINNQIIDLYRQITNSVIGKLSQQNNYLLKITLLNFVDSFHEYLIKVQEVLSLILSENPYQETPRLCGVYFTSALQLLGVNELLTKTIIDDKSIIEKTRLGMQNTLWFNSLGLSVACAMILGVFGLYSMAYSQNACLTH